MACFGPIPLRVFSGLALALGLVSGAELTPEMVTSPAGDGPDGKGNTADDTWQFWFELAHPPGVFRPLTRHSSTIPAGGIPGKVRGPVASLLPHPKETAGWLLHTDWDARFEGVWGDRTTKTVLVHPYVEKTAHRAVALTYRIPSDGFYLIAVKLTDMQVNPDDPQHDGITWKLEAVRAGSGETAELARGTLGDGRGRADSGAFRTRKTKMRKNYLVRLVIHPNAWWGQDLTRIDYFRIEKREPVRPR